MTMITCNATHMATYEELVLFAFFLAFFAAFF